jgi:hypothetical protein
VGDKADSGRPAGRRIDAGAKACFLAALRAGASREVAAAQAGFTSEGFYYARRRDPVFRLAWIWALALSAAEEREIYKASTLHNGGGAGGADGIEIAPNNKRRLQRRRVRCIRFNAARKKVFLDHFAGTADFAASAEAAGMHYSTVYNHRRKDPEFDAACAEALGVAYASLEAEAVRQRLEAQRNLRDGLCPKGEMPKEFDRVLRLLARYDRKDGRIGPRAVAPGRERRWSFDDAIALLDRKLRALGVRYDIAPDDPRHLLPPPPDAEDEA